LFLLLTVICTVGCNHSNNSVIDKAEMLLENQPDSVVAMLDTIDFCNTSESIRAEAAFLLTYARYKTFVDETSDSLIRPAVSYFIENNNFNRASLSLYLLGIIQKNQNHLGQSAKSLTYGAELAEKHHLWFTAALCYKELGDIYNRLYDGTQQVKMAEKSFNMFKLAKREDWYDQATLNLAVAYNNSHDYEKSLSLSKSLFNESLTDNKSTIAANAAQAIGLAYFCLQNYHESYIYYLRSLQIDNTILTENNWHNLYYTINQLDKANLIQKDLNFIDSLNPLADKQMSFYVFARNGQYKKAYESVETYRAELDSIIDAINTKNVAAAIYEYHENQKLHIADEIKVERLEWIVAILISILFISSILIVVIHKLKQQKEYNESLVGQAKELHENLSTMLYQNTCLSESLSNLYKQKFEILDTLSSTYYETAGTPTSKKILLGKIENLISDFRNDFKTALKLEHEINIYNDNLMVKFRNDFPEFKDHEIRLFLYTAAGFSNRTISLFIDEKIEVIYNRKSRLKAKIKKSQSPDKIRYLSSFSA